MRVGSIEDRGGVQSCVLSEVGIQTILNGPDGADPAPWQVLESDPSSLELGDPMPADDVVAWQPVVAPSVIIEAEDNFATQTQSRKFGLAAVRPSALEEFRRPDPAEDVWLIPRCPHSVARPGESLRTGGSQRLDVGVTLAAVAGRKQPVAGYIVALAAIRRDVAEEHAYLARSYSTHTHLGSTLFSVSELAGNAELSLHVNGEELQRASLGDLVVGAAELVATVRRRCTFAPGDVILLGTPPDTPFDRSDRWIRGGDVLAARVSGLGEHRAEVVVDR